VKTRERHGRDAGADARTEPRREGDRRPGTHGGRERDQARNQARNRERGAGSANGTRHGAAHTVLEGVRHIPAYLRLLGGLLFDSRVATLDKVLVVGAIVFVLSPADIIPNMIPVLGELDDLFILTLALQHLVAHADEQVLRDHWPGDPEELTQLSVGRMMAAVSFFLPLSVRAALRRRLKRRKGR
jgi:uncharacterized membrane protein YkvA (DUF1232 family)